MTTALAVTSRGHMLSPPDRYTPRAHVLTRPGEQSLEAALTETYGLLRHHGYLIAVYPANLPTPFVHRLHTVRAILESDRIALIPTELPPLAVGVLARQLRQLSLCDFSPGVLGAAARLLAHYIHAGALLGSVAKLDRIPVSLSAHAKSWMPGAQFAVRASPRPALVRLGGSEPGTLDGPEYATRLTLAAGNLSGDWVTQTLAPHWRVSEVQEAYLPEDSARWWGTGKLVEFAAAIPDVSVLYQLVASVRRDECHWCGLELIGDRCAFCAASAPVSGGSRATGRSAGRAVGRRTGGAAVGAGEAGRAAGRTEGTARTASPQATRAQPDPRQAPPQQTPAPASSPTQQPYAGPPPPQQPRPQSMPPRAEQVVRQATQAQPTQGQPAQGQPAAAVDGARPDLDTSPEPAGHAPYVEPDPYAQPFDATTTAPPPGPPDPADPLLPPLPEPSAEPPPEHSTPSQPADSATVQQGDRRP